MLAEMANSRMKSVAVISSRMGTGAGFVVDQRGLIVTNHHVVGDAKTVWVCLTGDSKITGEVILAEPERDLALVRIRPDRQLVPLPLAADDNLRPGDAVVTIGHPLGQINTVSTGTVSSTGLAVTLQNGPTLRDAIMANLKTNRGNSGGPLLNARGEVVGVIMGHQDAMAEAISAKDVKKVLAAVGEASRLIALSPRRK
jgi:S1-C subfamily serine protease